MLSSADGYCSIVVFDLGELGTVHATQQHHRQLANIAQSHSHPFMVPPSPAHSIALARQPSAPSRSEREGSTSSSIAPTAHQATSIPPLFMPSGYAGSSASSVTEGVLPTPGEEGEAPGGGYGWGKMRSGSESSAVGLGFRTDESAAGESVGKRHAEEVEVPKKKRRVALTHLGDSDAA
jgi:chromatin assembly factor 1 subunit B